MDIIFMNFENSKTFDSHRILLNCVDKINLMLLYKTLAFTFMEKYKNVKPK